MKRTVLNMSATAALTLVFSLNVGVAPKTSSAADFNLDAVLGLDQTDCCHVIDLLMHNRIRKSMGHAIGAIPGARMPHAMAGPQLGDLELLEVSLVTEGDGTLGPVYQVSFRNTSRCAVRDFRITIVGVRCRIEPTSPCALVCVPCIDAGETKCIEIQLPATAMAMSPIGGKLVPFDTLIIALDSFDELIECDELNNMAILKREEIGLLVVETPATPAVAEPGPTVPAEAVPSEGTAPVPDDKAIPSPLDKIDLDELDLGDSEETALRIALETI